MQNAQHLFGTHWREEFDLFSVPIDASYNKIDGTTTSSDRLKKAQKIKFLKIFSEGIGFCSKFKAKFAVKENIMPVFRQKRGVPYASVKIIDKELERQEKLGVIEKIDYIPWAAPTVYVKKENNKIRICADYSTGPNYWVKEINYPFPTAEEISANLNGGRIVSKLDLSEPHPQIPVEEKKSVHYY